MIQNLKDILSKYVEGEEFEVKLSESIEHGHISTNAAFALAKIKKTSPKEAAEDIRSYLHKNTPTDYFDHIDIAGKGFVNMYLTPQTIANELSKITRMGSRYGRPDKKPGETVIIEYSSPNIAKPMHVGHLRTTIIGDALARIFDFVGYKVVRWNYLGDWGTQFGKLIAAYKLWGSKIKGADSVDKLNELYVKFHKEIKKHPELEEKGREEFAKLEKGDKKNKKLWKKFKKDSIKEFNKIYNLLGVHFSVNIGEAFYSKYTDDVINLLIEEEIATESEGALIVDLERFDLPTVMVRKSDGATLYTTREIANLKYRKDEYKPSKILYVVGNEQALHFSQLFAISKLLGFSEDVDLVHVKHGLISKGDGKKLSTREGTAIKLEELLDKAISLAKKNIEKREHSFKDGEIKDVSKAIGLGAIKYNDLSQNRTSDISFDWDKMLSFEGNSGPYLQYTYARLKSILRKAGRIPKSNINSIENENDQALALKLAEFPDVLQRTIDAYQPNYLANYLYELSREINSFYHSEPVLYSEPGARSLRLNLVKVSSRVLKTGLGLLGIEVVEKM